MKIDWFAVDCVIGGTPLPLNHDERRAVVRRLLHRMAGVGKNARPGMLTAAQVGKRMGCTDRTVERIVAELPAADKLQCVVCGEQMWVRRDDVIEPHGDYLFKECPTSNAVFDADWEDELANTTVWLANRLRAGDQHGVWEYVERVEVPQMRRLLVAALAGVAETEDPFEWLKEAV